jgi:hypothetical protein
MPLLPRTVAVVVLALVCLPSAAGAAPAKSYTFMLALERDQGALDRVALRASAPASGRRGAYLPLAEVERRFGASAATRRAVTAFLRHRGARASVRGLGSMVVAKVPSRRVAGRLFGAGRRIPRQLRGKVTGVVPISAPAGSSARPPRAAKADFPKRSGTPGGCGEGVESGGFTPNQYVKAYGIDALHAAGLSGRGMRVALIETDGFRRSDIRVRAPVWTSTRVAPRWPFSLSPTPHRLTLRPAASRR